MSTDTCVFRGITMPNPFRVLAGPTSPLLVGKSIDGQFLIKKGEYVPASLDPELQAGYVEIHSMPGLDTALYPPAGL